jgi:hypothetical protein
MNGYAGGWIHWRRGDRKKSNLKTSTKPVAVTNEEASSFFLTMAGQIQAGCGCCKTPWVLPSLFSLIFLCKTRLRFSARWLLQNLVFWFYTIFCNIFALNEMSYFYWLAQNLPCVQRPYLSYSLYYNTIPLSNPISLLNIANKTQIWASMNFLGA